MTSYHKGHTGASMIGVGRRRRKVKPMTPAAGPVKVTRSDGTVEVQEAQRGRGPRPPRSPQPQTDGATSASSEADASGPQHDD